MAAGDLPEARVIKKRSTQAIQSHAANAYAFIVMAAAMSFVLMSAWLMAQPTP